MYLTLDRIVAERNGTTESANLATMDLALMIKKNYSDP